MEFVGNIVEPMVAPEIHITGVARIEKISTNVIRVSYCAQHQLPDGSHENRIVCHLDWDRENWPILTQAFNAARPVLLGAQHERLTLVPRD